ncbi:MAG: hypothetical protein EZS28_027239, partial [Streblomastix strix]
MPKVVKDLIVFAADSIIESETESKNHVQFTNVLEKIVADGTDDNGDDDQSEHAIQSMHFTNGNNGLRKIDSGTQLQATVKGEANSKINITKISASSPLHNLDRYDGLRGNGCVTKQRALSNENGHLNHPAIE